MGRWILNSHHTDDCVCDTCKEYPRSAEPVMDQSVEAMKKAWGQVIGADRFTAQHAEEVIAALKNNGVELIHVDELSRLRAAVRY